MAFDWGSLVSTGIKVAGSLLGSHAKKQEAKATQKEGQANLEAGLAQRDVAYQQANDAEESARRIRLAASWKAAKIIQQGRDAAGNALAAYAASGVTVGKGSTLYVPAKIVGNASEDAWNVAYEASDQADQYMRQASLIRKQGDAYAIAGGVKKNALNSLASNMRSTNTANTLLSVASSANDWLSNSGYLD